MSAYLVGELRAGEGVSVFGAERNAQLPNEKQYKIHGSDQGKRQGRREGREKGAQVVYIYLLTCLERDHFARNREKTAANGRGRGRSTFSTTLGPLYRFGLTPSHTHTLLLGVKLQTLVIFVGIFTVGLEVCDKFLV